MNNILLGILTLFDDARSEMGNDAVPLSQKAIDVVRPDTVGPACVFQTSAGQDGYIDFRGIPPGQYQAMPPLPASINEKTPEVQISEGSCAPVASGAVLNSLLDGKAIRFDGQSVAETDVSLIRLAGSLGNAIVERGNAEAIFGVRDVPQVPLVQGLQVFSTEYPPERLPLLFLFYPAAIGIAAAQIIESRQAQKLNKPGLRFQGYFPRPVLIQVIWPDERPAVDARVYVEYRQNCGWQQGGVEQYYLADERGRADFNAFGIGRIRIHAVARHSSGSEWISKFAEIDLQSLPSVTKLVLKNCNRTA